MEELNGQRCESAPNAYRMAAVKITCFLVKLLLNLERAIGLLLLTEKVE